MNLKRATLNIFLSSALIAASYLSLLTSVAVGLPGEGALKTHRPSTGGSKPGGSSGSGGAAGRVLHPLPNQSVDPGRSQNNSPEPGARNRPTQLNVGFKNIDLINQWLEKGGRPDPAQANKVVELVSTGLDKANRSAGYHGTTLSALLIAMETGHIPLGRSEGCCGHIYFFPTAEVQKSWPGLKPQTDDVALKEASGYAEDLSQAAFFAKALGLDLDNKEHWEVAVSHHYLREKPELLQILLARGVTMRQIDQLNATLDQLTRGFVLVISEDALEHFKISEGDPGHGDLKIAGLPDLGLPLNYLVGIEPLSSDDFDTMDNLRTLLKMPSR